MGKRIGRMSASERTHLARGAQALAPLEAEIRAMAGTGVLPPGWEAVAAGEVPGAGKRARVTIPLDAGVLRFFRTMGPGHLARMEAVLRAYVEFRLARAVAGADWCEVVADPKGAAAHWAKVRETAPDRRALLAQSRESAEAAVTLAAAYEAEKARADAAGEALKQAMALVRELGEEMACGEEEEDPE